MIAEWKIYEKPHQFASEAKLIGEGSQPLNQTNPKDFLDYLVNLWIGVNPIISETYVPNHWEYYTDYHNKEIIFIVDFVEVS